MKRIITSLALLISMVFPLAYSNVVSASVNIVPQCGKQLSNNNTSFCSDVTGAQSGTASDPVIKIIKAVMEVISWVAGVAAVILIIMSGIKFMTSGGDAQKVATARGTTINALIGIAVTILAQLIVVFVLDQINK